MDYFKEDVCQHSLEQSCSEAVRAHSQGFTTRGSVLWGFGGAVHHCHRARRAFPTCPYNSPLGWGCCCEQNAVRDNGMAVQTLLGS